MDTEHRRLIEWAGALLADVQSGRAKSEIAKSFRDLIDYTRQHFGKEESEMMRVGYAKTEWHMRQHAKLLTEAEGIYSAFVSDASLNIPALTRFFRTWLIDHIQHADLRLALVLNRALPPR